MNIHIGAHILNIIGLLVCVTHFNFYLKIKYMYCRMYTHSTFKLTLNRSNGYMVKSCALTYIKYK